MARSKRTPSLARVLGHAPSPIYVLDDRPQIIYANTALCTWLGVENKQLVGQTVSYHAQHDRSTAAGIAAGLCPPPTVWDGELQFGFVSRAAENGSLVYRRGTFLPLSRPVCSPHDQPRESASGEDDPERGSAGVIAVLDPRDATAEELEGSAGHEVEFEALHRAVAQLRQNRSLSGAGVALVGESDAMRRARRQVDLAAQVRCPVLVVGSDQWQRRRVAATIPRARPDGRSGAVVPFESKLLDENLLSWSLESLAGRGRDEVTLVVHDLHELSPAAQEFLTDRIDRWPSQWRVIATCEPASAGEQGLNRLHARLLHWLSTLVIELFPLSQRMEDLPLVVQHLVEEMNAAGTRQAAGFSQTALDRLYLLDWPGGLEQLREAVAAAHAATKTPEIPLDALPPLVLHAEAAAAFPQQDAEPIPLEQVLAEIEVGYIRRALELAEGNKTQAAGLLGMTRPRLYRRMEQLGLL